MKGISYQNGLWVFRLFSYGQPELSDNDSTVLYQKIKAAGYTRMDIFNAEAFDEDEEFVKIFGENKSDGNV